MALVKKKDSMFLKNFFENEFLKDMEIYQKKTNWRVRGTLKKAISGISNVSKKFFKKIYLFWVGPKWEVVVSFHHRISNDFFKFFFKKLLFQLHVFRKNKVVNWRALNFKKYQDEVPKTILCLLTQKTEHYLSLYSTCIHKMEMFILAT